MGLREIGWEAMDWNRLPPDWHHRRALVNTVLNFSVP